ncbi:MAG: tetratricopeptide repeat protein [Thermoplasmata archaeon]
MADAEDRMKKHMSGDDTFDLELHEDEHVRLISMFGGFRHEQIDDRRQMMELGNPAIILLLAYLLTLPGIMLEFFTYKHLWYFGFNLYSSYVFFLSTGCVLAGLYLIFRRSARDPKSRQLIANFPLFVGAASTAAISMFFLLLMGPSSPELAILFSILIVASVIAAIASARNMDRDDVAPFAFYGAGAVIVALVPVHQAFGIWGGIRGTFQFTVFDGMLIVIGVTMSLIALNAVKNRTGYLAAWLVGATLIALISFHELVGITPSGSFEIYDQALALEGAVYSLIPLSLYFISEYRSAKLWAHIVNAKRALDAKNYDKALKNGERAMEILSESGFSNKVSLPWSIYGDVFYRIGKFNRARTLYDIALQIDPFDYETWSNLGNMYLLKGYFEQALAAFARAAEIRPDDAKVWNNLGVAHLSSKRYGDAARAFRKAIEIDPQFATARYNLGMMLLRLGKPASAMRQFDELIAKYPDDEAYKKAHERTALLLGYFQQAAGWKILGLDVSKLVKAIVEKHSRFDDHYSKFLKGIISELHHKAYNGDRSESAKSIHRLLRSIGSEGVKVDELKAKSGMKIDQLRYSVAILALTGRARFQSVNNEIRLLPIDKDHPEERQSFGIRLRKNHFLTKGSSA